MINASFFHKEIMEDIIGYMLTLSQSVTCSLSLFRKLAILNKQYHGMLNSNGIYKVILNQLGIRSSENWKVSFEKLKHSHIWKRTRCKYYTIDVNRAQYLETLFEDRIICDNPLSMKYMKLNKHRLIEKFQPLEGDIVTVRTRYPTSSDFETSNYIMRNGRLVKFFLMHNYSDDKYPVSYWLEAIETIHMYIPNEQNSLIHGKLNEHECFYSYYVRYVYNHLEYTVFSAPPIDCKSLHKVKSIVHVHGLARYLKSINFDYDIHTTLVIS